MSGEWRPRYQQSDCCSSLSPISDCFFKAPVAEDINYPASVNHVIYRPRPLRAEGWKQGMKREGGKQKGWKWKGCNGCVARGLHRCQLSKKVVDCRFSLSTTTPISCLLLGNLSASRLKTSRARKVFHLSVPRSRHFCESNGKLAPRGTKGRSSVHGIVICNRDFYRSKR